MLFSPTFQGFPAHPDSSQDIHREADELFNSSQPRYLIMRRKNCHDRVRNQRNEELGKGMSRARCAVPAEQQDRRW